MPRIRKERNRIWTKEEKKKFVDMVLNNNISTHDVEKEYDLSYGIVSKWVRQYISGGIEALENKNKPGNPLAKYSNKKNLTEIEKLEYENMKLRIENERLKKGYLVKGDGTVVVVDEKKFWNSK